MTGANIARLAKAVAGMNPDDVSTSIDAWDKGRAHLSNVRDRMETVAPKIRDGFGTHSEIGLIAEATLARVARDVDAQRARCTRAHSALIHRADLGSAISTVL